MLGFAAMSYNPLMDSSSIFFEPSSGPGTKRGRVLAGISIPTPLDECGGGICTYGSKAALLTDMNLAEISVGR